MPYGSIYGIASDDMAIAGLYSHSVVYGDDTCGGDKEYHYYTVLTNYLKYARSVLGRTPKEFVKDKDGLSHVRRIINYRMKWPTSKNDAGTSMFGGDMLAIKKGPYTPQSDSLSNSSPDSTETNDTNDNDTHKSGTVDDNGDFSSDNMEDSKNKDDSGDDEDTDANNENTSEIDHHMSNIASDNSDDLDVGANPSDRDSAYTGPSKGAVIAMSVTIPLVVIALAILAYVLFRKHRKKYPLGKWRKGTIKRKSTVRALIEEIGGASRPEVLPTYNEIYDMRALAFQEQQVNSEQPSRH
ncbi:hypothetical protein H4S08_003649 [Coemansia sp. RSA 1365]|nr:hypothetical protein H4S08_003649 [Coemansia sp. RSA 1365]